MTVEDTIKLLIAQRDSAIYRLIDYRSSTLPLGGCWRSDLLEKLRRAGLRGKAVIRL